MNVRRASSRTAALIACVFLLTLSPLHPAADETQIHLNLASLATDIPASVEIDFENLEQGSSEPHDPEGGYIPNPLTLDGVTFYSPHSLQVGYCSSPTCQADPDNPHGGNMVLALNQEGTIRFPVGTGRVVLVVEGLGDVPFTVQVIDWDGNSTTASGRGILFGVEYVELLSDVGIQEVRVTAVGPTSSCPQPPCGPLPLSAVWIGSGGPSAKTGTWIDPVADVGLTNDDLIYGLAIIEDHWVDLRVRFSSQPFTTSQPQEVSWCLDTDQDLTTGNACGYAGADTQITLSGRIDSLFGGSFTLGGALAGANPCSIAHFDRNTNMLRLSFPRSYLPGSGDFRYLVRSTIQISSQEIYTDLAPNTGQLDLTGLTGERPPFHGPDICSFGKTGSATLSVGASGTVEFFPEFKILRRAPVSNMIQSGYFKTTADNRQFRRGLAEFDLPDWPSGVKIGKVFLVLTEGRAVVSIDRPAVIHEIEGYAPADMIVDTDDYTRTAVFTGQTIATDENLQPQIFSVDVTDLFTAGSNPLIVEPQLESIGFRIKLAVDPTYNEINNFGSGFGEPSTIPPRLVFVLAKAAKTVDPGVENSLVYTDPAGMETQIQVPADAFSETTQLLYDTESQTTTFTLAMQPAATLHATASTEVFVGDPFVLDAFVGSSIDSSPTLQKPLTVTLHYTDQDVAGLDERTLVLNRWDGSRWTYAACGPYQRRPDENLLVVPVCELGEFQLFGRERVLLAGLSLAGPSTAALSATVTLTTTTVPLSATPPITYHWQATGQADIIRTLDTATDSASFTWHTPGVKTITVTATDATGAQASTTHILTVPAPVTDEGWKVYLPLVIRMEEGD